MDASHAGPADIAGAEDVRGAVEGGLHRAVEDEIGLLERMVVPADQPGRLVLRTMNMVDSCAPKSESIIIFTVMPL